MNLLEETKKIDRFFKTISIEKFDNMLERNGINDHKDNKRLAFKRSVKRFVITGVSTFAISLIGLIVFVVVDFYIIHPSIYIMGIFIGLGWLLTGMSIIKRI